MPEELYGEAYAKAQSRAVPIEYIRLIREELPIAKSDQVLEVGVGAGVLLPELEQKSSHVFGFDINEWLLRHEKVATPRAAATSEHIPFAAEAFDKVISIHTLEHVPDIHLALQELRRVTKKGGVHLHIVPSPWVTRHEGALVDTLRMFPGNPIKAWDVAGKVHLHNFDKLQLEGMFRGTGFRVIEKKRLLVPIEMGRSTIYRVQAI